MAACPSSPVSCSSSSPIALLSLLQIASATLPVGAYSYSEGLEFAIDSGQIASGTALRGWLDRELRCGSVRLDGAIATRVYRAVRAGDLPAIGHWNARLGALRETAELRQQSEQMGCAIADLLESLDEGAAPWLAAARTPSALQFATGFGVAAARAEIAPHAAAIGFFQSWATNAIGAGVKLVPLGQTEGQKILRGLDRAIVAAADFAIAATDDELETSGWGLSLASMQHEHQRVRLFRS